MAQTTAISMFLGHHLVILLGKTGYNELEKARLSGGEQS